MMGCRDKVGSLHFDDVVVPDDYVLGEVNRGFDHAMGFIYRNRAYVISAKNLGTAARLLDMTLQWAKDRTVQGRPLADHENVAFAIAESEAELRAAKLLVYHAAWVAGTGRDYRHEAYVNKVFVARMVNRVVDRALQIHGAVGYAKESPVERWYRDLRVERIYDGTDEVNLAGITRNLVKGHKRPGEIL
jgi:acyl-CoA dehydrogenase